VFGQKADVDILARRADVARIREDRCGVGLTAEYKVNVPVVPEQASIELWHEHPPSPVRRPYGEADRGATDGSVERCAWVCMHRAHPGRIRAAVRVAEARLRLPVPALAGDRTPGGRAARAPGTAGGLPEHSADPLPLSCPA